MSVLQIPDLSVATTLSILSGSIAAYWVCWVIYSTCFHPLRSIPGPFLASITRLWIMIQLRQGTMEKAQRALHAKYGPLIRIAPNEVACASPDAVKIIYPVSGPLQKTDFYPVWGNNSFSKYPDHFSVTNEKVHSERRRIVNNVYSLSNVLKSESYIDKCSQMFTERLGEFADTNKVVDLGNWLQMYAFDVIGELYFGNMFGFMKSRHDHGRFIASLDTLMPPLCQVAVAPTYARPFILGSSVLIPAVRKALDSVNNIAKAARSCVAERCDALAAGAQPRSDLLQQLLDIRQAKSDKVDFGIPEIQQEAYVAIFAGSDTTAIAFRAVFYYLLKSPAVYQDLLAELDAAAESGQLSTPVKYSEAIKLPLLCACIKEAMRLHPSVALTMPRVAPALGLNLCGHHIPSGYRVGINPAVLQYDTSVFGADAYTYRPRRWLEDSNASVVMDRSMIQFGAGTRTCIGKNISLAELHKLVPQLLRTFTFELATPGLEWKTHNNWFNKQTGLNVHVKRRQ
ncbi:cytochrome P450 oxidoreductase [Thozetella sp. PMI_491]|nr:cytochrome P450 oxidoreductase [Thozetella sp. PMI_491]